MNWHQRYKEMKKALGMTNDTVAEITGNTPDSVRSVTQPNRNFPNNLKLAVWIYEEHIKNANQCKCNN